MDTVDVPVFIENDNKVVVLKLTKEQAEKVQTDGDYLEKLVNEATTSCCTDSFKATETLVDNNNTQKFAANLGDVESGVSTGKSEVENLSDTSNNAKSLYFWTKEAVNLLLTLYEEKESDFSKGHKRHKVIWDSVACEINAKYTEIKLTGGQCQSKMNGLKKTFKKICDHNSDSGMDRITWPFFERMNELFGKTGWIEPKAVASEAGPSPEKNTKGKKRKATNRSLQFDLFVEELREEKKNKKIEKNRQIKEKEERFQKIIELKEKQHTDKMNMLKELCATFTNK